MKKMIGLVAILAALILGSYYGMGMITERTLKKNISVVSQSNGLVVNVQDYHRGWFKSNALINWKLHVPAYSVKDASGSETTLPAEDFDIQIPLVINHGPVILADSKIMFGLGYAHSDIVLPANYADKFKIKYTDASTFPHLNASVFVNYLNNSTLNMDLPTFKLINKDGHAQFEWLGLKSDVSLSSDIDSIHGQVVIDGVNVIKDTTKTVLGKVSSHYNLHRTLQGIYIGDGDILSPSLVVMQDDKQLLDVVNLEIHSNSDIEKGLFHSNFKATLDKLVSDAKSYGPVVFDLSVNNFDAEVLARINDQVNNLPQGSDAERSQALISLLPELPKLLSKGPTVELKELSITMPNGMIKGNLLLSLPQDESTNPFQLIQKIQGMGRLSVTDAVMKQILTDAASQMLKRQAAAQPAMAAIESAPVTVASTDAEINQQAVAQADARLLAMVKSGLFVLQGSDYVMELNLSQGQLSINGKPFNPAMMQY